MAEMNRDTTMNAAEFHRFLRTRLRRPVQVRLNNNLHDVVSVLRGRSRAPRASIHQMFLDAPRGVLDALVEFIDGPTVRARREIRRYICENQHRIRSTKTQKRSLSLIPEGKHFHLRRLADSLNRTYFNARLRFDISWGRRPDTPPRDLRHVLLGNWNDSLRLIRIHPILDSPLTPRFFIEYIIYHEMVHIITPPEVDDRGRICHHTPRFRALEERFAEYKRALQWQDTHLEDLIRFYCTRPKQRLVRQLQLF